jgi:multiple sugar transport system permease protein
VADPIFWLSIRNSLVYTFASVALHLVVGGGLALLLNEKWARPRLRNIVRGLFILPWMFSLAAAALMWVLLYQPTGVINAILLGTGIIGHPFDFLGDRNLAMGSLVGVNVWKYFPWFLVIFLGALQSVPTDLYEAARIDGASRFQRFRHITLPILRPTIVAVTAIDLVLTYGVFDIVKLMTNGGPFRSTQTVAFYIWQVGLRDVNFGYGSAITVVMLIIVGAITVLYFRIAGGARS